MALPMSDLLNLGPMLDDENRSGPSDAAVACYVHGLAHLIDELGMEAALECAAGALLAIAAEETDLLSTR